MGWLTDWRRRRVLRRHRIDDALWERATKRLEFLPRTPKLRELALLFLAEKDLVGAHDLEVTDAMRVSIAAQACTPILELGLDWYAGWHGVMIAFIGGTRALVVRRRAAGPEESDERF